MPSGGAGQEVSDAGGWIDLGPAAAFTQHAVSSAHIGRTPLAVSYKDGAFGVVSGVCNHAGGPLGEGLLDGEYIVCPWHAYKFHRVTGEGEPGFEDDRVPRFDFRVENGRLLVNATAATTRHKPHHERHSLARPVERHTGAVRVLGLSTTAMDDAHPRYSTSDALLEVAIAHAAEHQCETKLIRLNSLKFRHCEGYYSKSAHACTWPCTITQMDPDDQLDQVYEALVHWCDVLVLSTPIRWGSASSLYFKMRERMNCVQNQITIRDHVLIQDKVASFIITGGQDNIQSVAGELMSFFSELGFSFPQFPFIAHSRGWSAEDMERNVEIVKNSQELREASAQLVDRSVELAAFLRTRPPSTTKMSRGGRKAHHLEIHRAPLAKP